MVKRENVPACFDILAVTDQDEIMAMKHKKFNVYGLQFHPESILTKNGKKFIENFLRLKEVTI